MTKEKLYDELANVETEYGLSPIDVRNILEDFFSQNVVIPKGDNRHQYADVLHEWLEGAEIEELGISNPNSRWWDVGGSIFWGSKYRIKPKEPVYEYMYYTSDGKTEWYTDDEYADMINSEPYECFKAIETKRERK